MRAGRVANSVGSAVDVADSTWFSVRPAVLAPIMAEPQNWPRWWPGLELSAEELRGVKGVRWRVPSVRRGPAAGLAGTAEVWLEPSCGGAVAHFFLRLRTADELGLDPRVAHGVEHHYRLLTKRAFWELADGLDPDRLARLTSASHTAAR